MQDIDTAFHGWYRFVLGYPPHLVRKYVRDFGIEDRQIVLDPFCGTGTTNVECLRLGIDTVGLEANPMAYFASRVKTNWKLPVDVARHELRRVILDSIATFKAFDMFEPTAYEFPKNGSRKLKRLSILSEEEHELIPKGFINPAALKKVLVLRDTILRVSDEDIRNLFLLSLATVVVNEAANVAFGPEIYVTAPKRGVKIIDPFGKLVEGMLQDLAQAPRLGATAVIENGDAREVGSYLGRLEHRISAVITSPPYPNEKDYTRTTRLESVILGLIKDKSDLRKLKEGLLRSNSRNVFVGDSDAEFVSGFESITRLADSIEAKRKRLGKTSGFEKLYHKIVRHYFGGMYRHLASLKPFLIPHAKLAYVVGDQMSFFRTHIKTAHLLAEIAESLGYRVLGIDLWRTRLATATKVQLEENILLLENVERS